MKWQVLLIGLLCTTGVFASPMDDVCIGKGYDRGVSYWIWNESYVQTDSVLDYEVNLTGTARKLNWSANPNVEAVVYKTTRTYITDGGWNGTIPKTSLSSDIQYVVFCTGQNEVPEFGTVAAMVAIVGAAGLFFLRKNS
jgi:hypothetical protein